VGLVGCRLELPAQRLLVGQRHHQGSEDVDRPDNETGDQPGKGAGTNPPNHRRNTHAERDETSGDEYISSAHGANGMAQYSKSI
jgi:hypothetical protein